MDATAPGPEKDARESSVASERSVEDLENEIEDLRQQLRLARCSSPGSASAESNDNDSKFSVPQQRTNILHSIDANLTVARISEPSPFSSLSARHPLLLLADSALPLGSFAYSSGLESYLAHTRSQLSQNQNQNNSNSSTTAYSVSSSSSSTDRFYNFLSLSVASLASTTLPYLLKAHRFPHDLETLDNDLDASTPCTVARRASVAQGLALLGVWERAYKASYTYKKSETTLHRGEGGGGADSAAAAAAALDAFSDAVKQDPDDAEFGFGCRANGHLAPLWGVVCNAMDVALEDAAYVFLLNHAKAVLSAAVRASVMGPYQAQLVLASNDLQTVIRQRLRKEWTTEPEHAGQNVPVLDLWVGRHELLYSRIFNS